MDIYTYEDLENDYNFDICEDCVHSEVTDNGMYKCMNENGPFYLEDIFADDTCDEFE